MSELRFTRHAFERLYERGISPAECVEVISHGSVIERYPDDTPFPSELLLGIVHERFLHVVVATGEDVTHVITAYEPDLAIWEPGFRVRRDRP
jgi:hypothetical protein